MAENEKEITGSQIAGGLIGAAVGNFQGTNAGAALFFATAPFIGPFALLTFFAFPVGGALLGTVLGARVGSQGLSRAAMMAAGAIGHEMMPTDAGTTKSS